MKKLANLKGAKTLNKNEQKNINGGKIKCGSYFLCHPLQCCIQGICYACLDI